MAIRIRLEETGSRNLTNPTPPLEREETNKRMGSSIFHRQLKLHSRRESSGKTHDATTVDFL